MWTPIGSFKLGIAWSECRWVEKNWGFTLPLFYGELWPFGILVPFGLLAPSGRGPLPVVTGSPLEVQFPFIPPALTAPCQAHTFCGVPPLTGA